MESVYIHIPFCKSICSYCDFCKMYYHGPWVTKYLNALAKEVDERYEGEEIKTLYIGGGTPSSLTLKDIKYLFEIVGKFKLSSDCEVSFECNLNDINEELLRTLKDCGVNRLSIGIESFNEDKLKFMERSHTYEEAKYVMKIARYYGFDNINVDLIYALPTEDMSVLKRDISLLLKLDVEHISTYSLIIENNTALFNKKIKNVSEELDAKMYKYICKKLKKKNYIHYEVSNFAKEGKESKHNLTYWNNEEYYGFGVGAHGYINNMRYENTRSLSKYMNDSYRLEELLVSNQEEMENEVILGLRKLKGISVSDFERKYQRSIFEAFNLEKAILKSYLVQKGDYLYIPEDKIYIMNEIINMIM